MPPSCLFWSAVNTGFTFGEPSRYGIDAVAVAITPNKLGAPEKALPGFWYKPVRLGEQYGSVVLNSRIHKRLLEIRSTLRTFFYDFHNL